MVKAMTKVVGEIEKKKDRHSPNDDSEFTTLVKWKSVEWIDRMTRNHARIEKNAESSPNQLTPPSLGEHFYKKMFPSGGKITLKYNKKKNMEKKTKKELKEKRKIYTGNIEEHIVNENGKITGKDWLK